MAALELEVLLPTRSIKGQGKLKDAQRKKNGCSLFPITASAEPLLVAAVKDDHKGDKIICPSRGNYMDAETVSTGTPALVE